MKRCPKCRRDYIDDTLRFCLDDGESLLDGPTSGSDLDLEEQPTQIIKNAPTPTPDSPRPPNRYLFVAAIGLPTFFLIAMAAYFSLRPESQPLREIRSVAVLPLENLSGDPAQEYFADGMTEALIGNLSQIASIKVISRTSVMRYKRSGKSIPEIARELGVEAIVEGSVQRSGDRVRISTQLIDAANDSLIWSRSFERQMSNILSLQSEIAEALVGELRAQLTPAERDRIGKTKTLDPRATEANLLGKHYFRAWTKESERKAVEEFQRAVRIEPEYAEAWANLADAWTVRAMVGDIGVAEAEKPTRDAAQRALAIDPDNGAAHMSMCFIQNNYGFDWESGENSCKRAIALDPNNAKAHFAYAYLLSRLERHDEMAEQMELAIKLDPAEPWWPSVYGGFLVQARRFNEAERYLKRAIEVDPNYMQTYGSLAELYVQLGRFDDALALRQEKRIDQPIRTAYIYALKGEREKALEILARAPKDDLHELALAYTALDDFDNAFEVINRSLDRGEGFMFGYANFLVLEKLEADPRWKDVRRRINLPA